MRMFLRSASGSARPTHAPTISFTGNGSRFNSIWPSERRSTSKNVWIIRASRLDSMLIISVDLFALFLAQVIAAHQLARPLDGRQRRPHFMRDEVDGLLVAMRSVSDACSARRTTKC